MDFDDSVLYTRLKAYIYIYIDTLWEGVVTMETIMNSKKKSLNLCKRSSYSVLGSAVAGFYFFFYFSLYRLSEENQTFKFV